MKFKYKQEVKVISGFYEGTKGQCVQDLIYPLTRDAYKVKLEDGKTVVIWADELSSIDCENIN